MLWHEHVDRATIRAFFAGDKPTTAKGRSCSPARCSRRATSAAPSRARARRMAERALQPEAEEQVLDIFGDLLTRADDKARMERRLYAERRLRRIARRRSPRRQRARRSPRRGPRSTRSRRNAKSLLEALPSARARPRLHFRRIQWLRRTDKYRRGRAADARGAAGRRRRSRSGRVVGRAAARSRASSSTSTRRHRLQDRPRRRAADQGELQGRARVHRRLDRAALPARSRTAASISPASPRTNNPMRWRAAVIGRAAPPRR